MQYADQGFLEVDGTLEWDNDYPNPVRPLPTPALLLPGAGQHLQKTCIIKLRRWSRRQGCLSGAAQITLTAPDKVTTDPGTVTVQFDNVLNEVHPQPGVTSHRRDSAQNLCLSAHKRVVLALPVCSACAGLARGFPLHRLI